MSVHLGRFLEVGVAARVDARLGTEPGIFFRGLADACGVSMAFDTLSFERLDRGEGILEVRLQTRGGADLFWVSPIGPGLVVWDLRPSLCSIPGRGIFEELYERATPRIPEPASRARLRALLESLARAAVLRCDPVARRVAMRFPPELRWPIYRALEGDESGRVAQCAEVCPGAMLLLAHFERWGYAAARAALLRELLEARRGRRIDRIIEHALDLWREQELRRLAEQVGVVEDAWPRAAGPGGWPRARARLRLLVRRAGPRVEPDHLLAPPPVRFEPSDIPRRAAANARWFAVMHSSRRLLADLEGTGDESVLATSSWLSARSEAHWRHLCAPDSIPLNAPRDLLEEMIDYLGATGRRPSRRSDAGRLYRECQRWHERMATADGGFSFAGIAPDTALPPPPLPPGEHGPLRITAIEDVAGLHEEGRRMRHCVASWAPRILAGAAVVYHLECDGEPYTLGLTRSPSGAYRVAQLVGLANAAAPTRVHELVFDWLREQRAPERSVRSQGP